MESNDSPEIPDGGRHQTSPASLRGSRRGRRLAKLVQHLNKASTAYSIDIHAEKTKPMTNKTSSINKEIKVNGQKLATVTRGMYLDSVVCDEGSKRKILFMIAHMTALLTRLKPVWKNRSISFSVKI